MQIFNQLVKDIQKSLINETIKTKYKMLTYIFRFSSNFFQKVRTV